jgi:hypothetical protein
LAKILKQQHKYVAYMCTHNTYKHNVDNYTFWECIREKIEIKVKQVSKSHKTKKTKKSQD